MSRKIRFDKEALTAKLTLQNDQLVMKWNEHGRLQRHMEMNDPVYLRWRVDFQRMERRYTGGSAMLALQDHLGGCSLGSINNKLRPGDFCDFGVVMSDVMDHGLSE